MIPFKPVKKIGARWEGQVVMMCADGRYLTNLPASELIRYARKAKTWFKVARYKNSVRGLKSEKEPLDRYKLNAVVGSSGFVELVWGEGALLQENRHCITEGSSVIVKFHV